MFDLLEDTRYGRFLVPKADQYVGEALRVYGEYSQIEVETILQLVKPDRQILVIGANLGALVVPIARHAGEVVAFEPQRWLFQLCAANCVLNNLINVRAYWGACGQRGGTVKVPILDPEQPNNFGALSLPEVQELPGDLVPVYVLDKMPHLSPSLLVVDVEGMELDVLRGATDLISRTRPVLWFEADRELKRKELFAFVRSMRYNLFWSRTLLFNPGNYHNVEENRYEQTIAENVLAVPMEAAINVAGFVPVLA